MYKRLVTGILLCVLGVPLAPAWAQVDSREGIQLQNQILDLRHQLDALQAGRPAAGGSNLGGYQPTPLAPAAGAGAAAPGALDAQLLDRVQRLEDTVRELRGRIDDADNTRQRQIDDLNKKIDDLSFKLGNAPAAGTPATLAVPAVPPAAPPPPPAASAGKRTPEMLLQEGNAALARHDYPAAEAAAKEVLANGRGPRATDAQFLLAQTMAGRHDYSAAAVAFDDAYNRSRTGTHAADSLLGLANALTAINEKRAACATLDKLRSEFPSPRADLREPIAAARKSAACR